MFLIWNVNVNVTWCRPEITCRISYCYNSSFTFGSNLSEVTELNIPHIETVGCYYIIIYMTAQKTVMSKGYYFEKVNLKVFLTIQQLNILNFEWWLPKSNWLSWNIIDTFWNSFNAFRNTSGIRVDV